MKSNENHPYDLIIVGGGAAGMFAGLRSLEHSPAARVLVLEKGPRLLSKLKVSGGGRCNVTHAAFDIGSLVKHYPRGQRELRGPFSRWQVRDMCAWLEGKGVGLKTEADGRIFPVSDDSQTIIDCYEREARRRGLEIRREVSIREIERVSSGFRLLLKEGEVSARRLLLAVGGLKPGLIVDCLEGWGHSIEPLVPSLFTFRLVDRWVKDLAGVSVDPVRLRIRKVKVDVEGPVLFTHWGMSGPAILKASAWGARDMACLDYRFQMEVDWVPGMSEDVLRNSLGQVRQIHGKALIKNHRPVSIPQRLWDAFVGMVDDSGEQTWNQLSKKQSNQLVELLKRSVVSASGKSLNKEEFVTCGGVRLKEVDLKTGMSRKVEGLYFAGECLDIDGVTGGFNFQAAWTTGEMVAQAVAEDLKRQANLDVGAS